VTYNHFVSIVKARIFEFEKDKKLFDNDNKLVQEALPKIVNGYDGFGGAHNNLIWSPNTGHIYYTLNNKLIQEDTKARSQEVFSDSAVRLSCLTQFKDKARHFVAAGEGEYNIAYDSDKNPYLTMQSYIWIYETNKKVLYTRLDSHPVQSLAFLTSSIICAVGTIEENFVTI
jgi:hypothetical protein